MIFEIRSLRRVALSFFGVFLVFAGIFTHPIVTVAGFAVIGLTFVMNMRSGGLTLNLWAPELLKGVGLGLGAAGLIVGTTILVAAGGVLRVIGCLIALSVLAAALVAVVRFCLPTYAVWISTLYNRWVKKKRDFQEAIWQTVRGELEEALASLARYEAKAPSDSDAKSQRAFVLLSMNRLPDAAEEAERSVAMARTAIGFHVRGQILLAAGATERARKDIEEAIRIEPKRPWTPISLAAVFIEQRRLDAATELLKHANRGGFRFPSAFLLLGDAYRLLGRPKEALKAYKDSSRVPAGARKSFPVNSAEVGRAFVHLGRPDDAERALNTAVEYQNALVPALHGLALLAASRGDEDGALEAIERLLAVRPHAVVTTLSDPLMTPLLVQERFRQLLGRAIEARDSVREEVLTRVSGA